MVRQQKIAAGEPGGSGVAWPKIAAKYGRQLDEHRDSHLLFLEGALSPAEAKALVAVAERIGFSHQGSRGAAYGEAFRDNDRLSVEDPAFAERLWQATGLAACFSGRTHEGNDAVGLNPDIRIYRYSKGQRFGRHIDDSVELGGGRYTAYTLLIYLTSCGGGETVFYGTRNRVIEKVAPVAGLALLHLHGEADCLDHEAAAVTAGAKIVLRSDVVFQRGQ